MIFSFIWKGFYAQTLTSQERYKYASRARCAALSPCLRERQSEASEANDEKEDIKRECAYGSCTYTHRAPHSNRSQFRSRTEQAEQFSLFSSFLFCSSHFYFYYLNEPMRSFIIQKRLPIFFPLRCLCVWGVCLCACFVSLVVNRTLSSGFARAPNGELMVVLTLTAFKCINFDICMSSSKWWINRFIIATSSERLSARASEYANGY